jgi:RHS repeat-associated protein
VAWLNAERGRMVGPGRTQEIYAGDSLKLQVHGKYLDKKKQKANAGSFVSQGARDKLINDLNELAVSTQRAGGANPIALFNLAYILTGDLQKKSAPEAYLIYALYDQDNNRYEVGKKVLTKNAANQHEVLEENLYISKDGYMETFVVNETSEDVWFDNMMVMSISSVIVQETHYDPWGLELTGLGFQYGEIKANKYLYNGKELIEDNGLQYYDYGARMYDPAIGRWGVVDPLADAPEQIDKSPYAAFWNNPIRYNDPDGRCPDCPTDEDVANAFAADLLSVKNSLYSLFTRPFGYEATFVENERGNFDTGFVKTSDGFGTGTLKYGLDALNVVTFGRGGGVTGGILAKSGAGTSVVNGSKELLKANKEAGKVGEDFLNNAFGGTPQVSIGIGKERRVIDNLTESGVAQESKVGRTSLTKTVQRQISKDVDLINNPNSQVRSSEWHFFPGKGLGPTKPLQNELNRVRIPFVVHD